MKESGKSVALAAIATFWVIGTLGAQSAGDYFVAERGPHHRVMQRVTWQTNLLGAASATTNGYTELATGMHFLRDGQWLESRAEIELTAEGAAATNCAHPVRFASDLNSVGAVDLTLPDGRHLRSRVIGLGFYDAASGEAVLIAQTRSVNGLLVPPNQVIYTNALAGEGVVVDVQYVVTPAGLEQNLLLHAVPAPEAFGLSPASTRLQCLTEFFDPPVPQRRVLATTPEGLSDEAVDFDSMTMPPGRAFAIGDAGVDSKRALVFKQWVELANRRTILVEQLPFANVREQLDRLPTRGGGAGLNPVRRGSGQSLLTALEAVLPEPLPTAEAPPVRMARLENWTPRGFLVDYSIVSSTNDFTFKGDSTYYVANTVNLSGTTRIEGGTVVKWTNSATAKLNISGPITCQTGPFRPAVFTSKDDNSIGESITGSTGTPTNYSGFGIEITSSGNTLTNLRFSYLQEALRYDSGGTAGQLDLAHVQFVKCRFPLKAEQPACFTSCGATIQLDNALAYGCDVFFQGDYGILRARHLTVNQCNTLGVDDGYDSSLHLTNSLLVAVTNWGDIPYSSATNKVVYYPTDPGGIFRTVGAGAHYLADNSTNCNTGTTNLSAALATALQTRTTHPPFEITTNFTANTTLAPRAERDTDTPDLGYHYDPLDYALGGVHVTNATLTLNPGTAVAVYSTAINYGLVLLCGSKFISTGTPTLPNWIVRSHLVQEQANLNWTNVNSHSSVLGNWLGGTPPEVQCRFTKWAAAADANYHFSDYLQAMPVWFTDCEFHGGKFKLGISSAALTNCLFERVYSIFEDVDYGPMDLTLRNCLFHGGQAHLTHCESGTWTVTDTLFDQAVIHQDCEFASDYNGYTASTNCLNPPGDHDVLLTNTPVYLTSHLGRFYYPTNDGNLSRLIDAGSSPAEDVGLSPYTMVTNQVKEAATTVDIGFHYVATDANGVPLDTDGDGLNDLEESFLGTDANSADTDYDGRSDLLEAHTDGTNPSDSSDVVPTRLGYWRFNNGTFAGEMGQQPLQTVNVAQSNSWSTKALAIGSDSASRVVYRDVETNDWANINCREGTVRFWFKPHWNSADRYGGPLSPVLYLGDPAATADSDSWNNCWFLGVGYYLGFLSASNYLDGGWLAAELEVVSNQWCQIVFTYSDNDVSFYKNGELLESLEWGITRWPNASHRSNGLTLGNWPGGGNPLDGQLEELETFNYRLSAAAIARNFDTVKRVDSNLNGMADLLEEISLTNSAPFMPVPFPVIGVFEAEQFDHGGPEVGYHALDAANATTNYRVSRLWITNCDDMGGGFCVDKLRTNEWLQYTMDVTVSQTYAVETRVAGIGTNGAFKLEFFTNGTLYAWTTNNLVLTSTDWANVTFKNLLLTAGTNVMKVTMLTNGLVNGQDSGYAARLNYISIYPSWNEGLPASATDPVTVGGLTADTNDWLTASNNAVHIQDAIDRLAASGGIVHITNIGRFYVASREITVETNNANRNTAVFIYRNNVQIQGAGKTETTLVAHNRAVTVFYVGSDTARNPVAVTNITLADLTLEGSPNWVYDSQETTKRRWDESGLQHAEDGSTGCLIVFDGKSVAQPAQNLLVTNCVVKNSSWDAIWISGCVNNFLARNSDILYGADGTNGLMSGHQHDVGIWVHNKGPSLNVNVIECNYNGNAALTNITTTSGFGDGILWCQGLGGNWFAARNTITNYDLEGIQWNGGPAAAVQNTFFTYKSSISTCALNNPVTAGAVGPTGRNIDRSFAFVGNEVTGGWHGIFGYASHTVTYVPLNALLVGGNAFALYAPPAISNPSSAVRCWRVDQLNLSGNTLVGGGMGLDVWTATGICTNAVLLGNDFSNATNSSLRDIGLSGDLLSAAIVKNQLSSGVKSTTGHLESWTVDDGPHYFLLYNEYVDGEGDPSALVVKPGNLPVHVVP